VSGKNTKERLIDIAEELFAQNGYHGVSIRDIAGALDMSIGSVYGHFKNKEEIYKKVLERSREKWQRGIVESHSRELVSDNSGAQAIISHKLIQWFLASYQYLKSHPETLYLEAWAELEGLSKGIDHPVRQGFFETLSRITPEISIKPTVLWAFLKGLQDEAVRTKDFSNEDLAQFIKLAFRAVTSS
jgi:AcrR family transcriptional regulator